MKKQSSQQSGRSMMEAMAYISLMILVTISMTAAVNSGYDKFKLGRINQELSDLKKVIGQRYVVDENYKEVKFDTLINEKIVPYDVRDKRHSFGGDISIGYDNGGATYYIQFSKVPHRACIELGNRVWIVNDGSDLDSLKINEKVWAWKSSAFDYSQDYYLPALVGDVGPACKNNDENILKWVFN